MSELPSKQGLLQMADRYEMLVKKLREAAALMPGDPSDSVLMIDPNVVAIRNQSRFAGGGTMLSTEPETASGPDSHTKRELEVYSYLSLKGPQLRKDIIEGTDIPEGTLSRILRSELFEKGNAGRWRVRPAIRLDR